MAQAFARGFGLIDFSGAVFLLKGGELVRNVPKRKLVKSWPAVQKWGKGKGILLKMCSSRENGTSCLPRVEINAR